MSILQSLIEGRDASVIQKGATALEAARRMAAENIGALIVLDGEKMVGIFTERDLMRRVIAQGKDPAGTPVSEATTSKICIASPTTTVEEALRMMRQAQCRHLPVVEGGKLRSVVSIRDLIETDLSEKKEEIRWMKEYIQYEPPPPP